MNDLEPPSDQLRLEQLTCAKCNGSLTPEETAELHALLARSGECRAAYCRLTATHADLEWGLGGKGASHDEVLCQLPGDLLVGLAIDGASPVASARSQRRAWWPLALAASIAAILIGGWALGHLNGRSRTPHFAESDPNPNDAAPAPAQISSLTPHSRWSFGRPGDRNPRGFHFGETVWVEQGLVEMQLAGGTIGQLQAPVILQLLSQNRVRLLRGKIKVHVPARTDGFTVETPSAEVVDLGTEFSVEAAETGTDLVVYGGKVDLKVPHNGSGASRPTVTSKQFTAGQAVRVDLNGTLSRIMNVKSSAYPSALDRPKQPQVITSVVDNIRRDDVWAYYEIVWGGMAEDANAFVDRFHQWNGADASGIPTYLVGGDYVKTFNDDKMADEYQIEVDLARPATLYVLLDTRASPPQWLTDSFTNTGDRIGIDETHHHRPGPTNTLEAGPGNSIDRLYSIWKMDVPAGGRVVLGPNGKSPTPALWNNSMYGIVAVPLPAAQLNHSDEPGT